MTQPTPWLLEPVLSPRLVLRPRRDTAADRAAATELLTDPQVQRYLGGPHPADEVNAVLAEPAGERWGSFLAELRDGDEGEEGTVIGECMLTRRFGELEVGYLFLPRHWGRGLAGEAVATILGWAAEHLDDGHVTAVTQATNTASCRLLTRLGFVERERFVRYDADQIRFSAPLRRDPPALS